MATTSKKDKIFIGIDDQVVELTGKELEEFEAERKVFRDAELLLEAKYKAKQEARENAIKKLAEIAGLTNEEIAAIL